ncbi:hypothetical protein LG198_12025 [Methylobacillus arboreus]|uniref:hypothetical protein n=1 Tax=Methylobacillus arboreus TaxID=755170 RepID=UPI001E2C9DA5|nr:hypothetical protein [Methylobacillus arboreus]MCB5191456.1 hypothetical protein [Methylobacillus arboreus]
MRQPGIAHVFTMAIIWGFLQLASSAQAGGIHPTHDGIDPVTGQPYSPGATSQPVPPPATPSGNTGVTTTPGTGATTQPPVREYNGNISAPGAQGQGANAPGVTNGTPGANPGVSPSTSPPTSTGTNP